jgi:hypothetical protein
MSSSQGFSETIIKSLSPEVSSKVASEQGLKNDD